MSPMSTIMEWLVLVNKLRKLFNLRFVFRILPKNALAIEFFPEFTRGWLITHTYQLIYKPFVDYNAVDC